jgi:hypothetical protein
MSRPLVQVGEPEPPACGDRGGHSRGRLRQMIVDVRNGCTIIARVRRAIRALELNLLAISMMGISAHPGEGFSKHALEAERLGLFSAEDFRLTTGVCEDCSVPRAALWYFERELIAVAKPGVPISGAEPEPTDSRPSLPAPVLVWIGAPEIVEHATLEQSGALLRVNGTARPFAVAPKLPTNRSYVEASTVSFWSKRSLRIRGGTELRDGNRVFVARTVWPEDTRFDTERMVLQPLRAGETLGHLVRTQIGGAEAAWPARLLWARRQHAPRRWAGRPVLAFLLSGAQGDDDGAHAGHLSVATGAVGLRGEWADWLVNNYYSLDEESEKGILAATIPMDSYLMDLNSGQSFYRPVYVLLAILREARVAERAQAALQDAMLGLYCHDLLYDHATNNSTAITVDALRQIGWNIPARPGGNFPKGVAAFVYAAIRERSVTKGKQTFGYVTEERTRVFPLAAFAAIGHDLLGIAGGHTTRRRDPTPYERMLHADVEAVIFVTLVQVPSTRPSGTHPVGSPEEYRERVPAQRSKWNTVSQPRRPFPAHLKRTCGPDPRRSEAR